jgi:hypothetical protein
MKHIISFFLLSFLILYSCIQKNTFDDAALSLTGLIQIPAGSTGIPKSFGSDMLIYSRLGRGCETRIGNLMADVVANRAKAELGLYNSGGIRDDFGLLNTYPNRIIPKGTVPSLALIRTFIPFRGSLVKLNVRAFRLKQILESSVSRLNNKAERNVNDMDSDGATHGNCWLNPSVSGSGRFLNISNKLSIEVNPSATPLSVTGNGALNTLRITNEGKRITRIVINSLIIYNNPLGDMNSGWESGNDSCTIKGIQFTNSYACNYYTVAVQQFQFEGGDSNPSMKPEMLEIGGDGSVQVLESGISFNSEEASYLHDYMQSFTNEAVFSKVTNRIVMP